MRQAGFIFERFEGSVYLGKIFRLARGIILPHQRKEGLFPQVCGDAVQDGESVFRVRGQNEMPHYHALLHYPLFIKDVFRRQLAHFQERGKRAFGIIGSRAVTLRGGAQGILVIGKPDVHDVPQKFERLQAFIAAAVIDDGQGGTINVESAQNARDEMRGGDKFDIVCARIFEQSENVRKLARGHGDALAAGERIILTVNAFERAAGKEDGAAAAAAAYGRLFPNMAARPADTHLCGHAAKTQGLFPVRAAGAGAQKTVHLKVLSKSSASMISYATCPSSSASASSRFSALRRGRSLLYCLILQ